MRPKEEPESAEATLPIDLEDSESDEKEGRGVKIELRDVWFKYTTRDVPVLQGLNMTVSSIIVDGLGKC
jgi:ABC-type multidrug transport system fused ATPase/permease subunit